MITEEVRHIFNRIVFLKNKFEMKEVDNSILLLTLLTENDSEITNLLFSICNSDDIIKIKAYASDLFATDAKTKIADVKKAIEESLGTIPEPVQTKEDGNTPLEELQISTSLSNTLLSATGAKSALAGTLFLDENEIIIDSIMLFYGLVDITNEGVEPIRKSIESILNVNDAVIGEALLSKFNPSYKSTLLSKKRETKNKNGGIKVFSAENYDELRNIMDQIAEKRQAMDDDDDDDDIEEGISNGNMVKVCNLVDPYDTIDLVPRDEYTEQIATLMSQCGNRLIAIVGEKGSGLTYFKYLINAYINQRYANKYQNLHYHKIFSFNTEYIKSELAKGNEGLITLFYTIGKFLENNNGHLFIDDFGSMFDVEKSDITESALLNLCDWNATNTPTVIVTMTPEQYSERIEKSSRLHSMFMKVSVPNMSDEDAIKCYNFVKRELDANHLCKLDTEEVKHALRLAKKYVKDCAVPKSLIRIADLAGSIAMGRIDVPEEIIEIEKRYQDEIALDIQQKVFKAEERGLKGTSLDHIYAEGDKTRAKDKYKLKKAVRKFRTDTRKLNLKVSTEDIEQAITMITGIPSDQMNEDEIKKVALLGENLRQNVMGQDEAIDVVSKTLKRRAVGLSANKSKTIGNLIFCGESGVGKTELAKQLAKYMFGDEKNMVRIDMSEFSERHTLSKLIGTSAGFVGYENDGILTKAVREKKYCVVLLDEMEKAAPEIFNLFLQVFDDGRITTGQGELVDFTNSIIIMTSNVGARKTQELGDGIGFSKRENYKQDIFEKELRKTFQPEFLNRIDNIVVFNHLSEEAIENITRLQLNRLVKTMAENGRELKYSESVVKFICNEANKEVNMGARPINRAIQNLIEVPIADLIVDNYQKQITGIQVDCNNDKVELSEYLCQKEEPKKRGRKKKVASN